MSDSEFGNITYESAKETSVRQEFLELLKECPIPDDELLQNLGLFLSSKSLARILFMNHIYSQIVDVPGVVVEFGTRWGQNLSLFAALRGIYDTFHRHRKIVGFDTFQGFPTIHEKDGGSVLIRLFRFLGGSFCGVSAVDLSFLVFPELCHDAEVVAEDRQPQLSAGSR